LSTSLAFTGTLLYFLHSLKQSTDSSVNFQAQQKPYNPLLIKCNICHWIL